ncbi:MAG: DUF6644 family protein [Pseudomonadota bacterium]
MPTALPFPRTVSTALLLALGVYFALSEIRIEWYASLRPFFEWMETTAFGRLGKSYGGAFALVQAMHLLSMAVLGGTVLVSDARLMGIVLKNVPINQVLEPCHRLFNCSLSLVVLSGVFMACGVAIKVYYLEVFWYKMLALAMGVLFAYFVRRPLLKPSAEAVPQRLRTLVGVASLMTWFTVAATGRWIGFSG